MLETILRHLNNWFVHEIYADTYTVANGGLELPFLKHGQYFRVIGSVFNDGLHQYPSSNLMPETFEGVIQSLAIPRAVIELANEIETSDPGHAEIGDHDLEQVLAGNSQA